MHPLTAPRTAPRALTALATLLCVTPFMIAGCGSEAPTQEGQLANMAPAKLQFINGPCEADVIIARLIGTSLPTLTGLTISPLFDPAIWGSIPMAAGGGLGVPPGLKDIMEDRYIIVADNGSMSDSDLTLLSNNGFDDFDYSCPTTALGHETALTPDIVGVKWHAEQTGAYLASTEVIQTIDALEVANDLETKVTVAVLDTGVDPIVPTRADGWSFYPGINNWHADLLGHGTSVAHLVNETTAGSAEILSIKVLNAYGRGSSVALAKGLMQALSRGAEVYNLSLGFPKDPSGPWGRLPNYVLEALRAVYLSGGRVFAAAGNECGGPPSATCEEFLPAASPWVLNGKVIGVTSVSGLDPDGGPSKAAVNKSADIWAPSELICTTTSSSVNASNHQRLSGTSFAAPQVSGAMALFSRLKKAQLATTSLDQSQITAVRDQLLSSGLTMTWPIAGCGAGVALDMCQTASDMGVTVSGCAAWTSPAGPTSDYCPWADSAPQVVAANFSQYGSTPHYAQPFGPAPVELDHLQEAMWCNGYSSSPAIPPCTSCEVEVIGGDWGTFYITLRVSPVWLGFTDWQLKIEDTLGNESYIALDLQTELASALSGGWSFGTVDYTATLNPDLANPPHAAYLVNEESLLGDWAGVQLMVVNTP